MKLPRYSDDLSSTGAFCNPNQLAANFISRELSIGKAHVPIHTPYIVADVASDSWPVPAAEHSMDITKWPSNS